MKVGFTGTRNGLANNQALSLLKWLDRSNLIEFHHGACRGADVDAVEIVRFNLPDHVIVVAHPGVSAGSRIPDRPDRDAASIDMSTVILPEKTHFDRNRDIVNETDLLVACPPCKPLPPSGGTAYTVNYARKVGKKVVIIWPDGTAEDNG